MLHRALGLAAASILLAAIAPAAGEGEAPPPDPIAALAAAGEGALPTGADGEVSLGALLARLDIREDSQVLVFTKGSLQKRFISPANPRAIYFSDQVTVASIPGAPLIELSAIGRDGTTRYYALTRAPAAKKRLVEDVGCLGCHDGGGKAIASVTPFANGEFASCYTDPACELTDSRSPFDRRWGGWYVTGRHGAMRHRGNVFVEGVSAYPVLDPVKGQNVTDLSRFFDTGRYLKPTSDIVALMTIEHRDGFLDRVAVLKRQSFTGDDAYDAAVEDLADYMLGVGEAPLTAPVSGVSTFSQTWPAQGPRDTAGRTLRAFDLNTRLFRYPLSAMIYSPAFDALPPNARTGVLDRLLAVLSGADRSPRYAGLDLADRRAALEIAASTKPGLPPAWRDAAQRPSSSVQR